MLKENREKLMYLNTKTEMLLGCVGGWCPNFCVILLKNPLISQIFEQFGGTGNKKMGGGSREVPTKDNSYQGLL